MIDDKALSQEVVRALVAHKKQFLNFLEWRVGSRDEAEELLQTAFVKGIEREDSIRDAESVIAWAYRLLRNALIDRKRRLSVQERSLIQLGKAVEQDFATESLAPDLKNELCACMTDLLKTLKPEYAKSLQQIDLGGQSLTDFAREHRLTPNNAAFRLHRARQALRHRLEQACGACSRHGCLDCTCRQRCDS